MPGPVSDDDYPDDFASSVVSDIGQSLFSKNTPAAGENIADLGNGETVNEEVVEAKPAAEAPANAEIPPAAVVPGQNSVGKPLPKSWKREVAPLWEKADPALHEYVYSREADMMRGIQQYAQGYQQWDSLIKPFASVFQQHPDVQPVQIMQGLMNTHLQLLNPDLPSERKLAMAKEIFSAYGIDIGETPVNAQPQYVQQLEQRLAQIEGQSRLREQQAFAAGVAEQERTVIAFSQDPKNKYFSEVQNDILRFIQSGAAQDLPTAYELACYANPAVRVKLLADQQAASPPPNIPKPRAKDGTFINIESTETKPPRIRKGTITDTINDVISAHFPKH